MAKRIVTQMLVIATWNRTKDLVLRKLCVWYDPSRQTIICSKLATQAQEYGGKTVQDKEWRH